MLQLNGSHEVDQLCLRFEIHGCKLSGKYTNMYYDRSNAHYIYMIFIYRVNENVINEKILPVEKSKMIVNQIKEETFTPRI
jgi:hypothetical protein